MEVRSKSKSNTRGRKPQAAVKAEKQPSTKRVIITLSIYLFYKN